MGFTKNEAESRVGKKVRLIKITRKETSRFNVGTMGVVDHCWPSKHGGYGLTVEVGRRRLSVSFLREQYETELEEI